MDKERKYCLVPVSIGELWDKYSILMIKLEKIKDTEKRNCVLLEIKELEPLLDEYPLDFESQLELVDCNHCLWNVEDAIRVKERNKTFDDEFIQLARSVYITNDRRADIKKRINGYFQSNIVEVKSYQPYL